MEHITMEYGQATNLLQLSGEELQALEPFLLQLGVRVRTTKAWTEGGRWIEVIQAENPYQSLMPLDLRARADSLMSPEAILWYKR